MRPPPVGARARGLLGGRHSGVYALRSMAGAADQDNVRSGRGRHAVSPLRGVVEEAGVDECVPDRNAVGLTDAGALHGPAPLHTRGSHDPLEDRRRPPRPRRFAACRGPASGRTGVRVEAVRPGDRSRVRRRGRPAPATGSRIPRVARGRHGVRLRAVPRNRASRREWRRRSLPCAPSRRPGPRGAARPGRALRRPHARGSGGHTRRRRPVPRRVPPTGGSVPR